MKCGYDEIFIIIYYLSDVFHNTILFSEPRILEHNFNDRTRTDDFISSRLNINCKRRFASFDYGRVGESVKVKYAT